MRVAILLLAILTGASLVQAVAQAPLRIHLENDGEPRDVRLTIEDVRAGTLVEERDVTVETTLDLDLDLPGSIYTVGIHTAMRDGPLPALHDFLDGDAYVGASDDTRGCPGPFLFSFWTADDSMGSDTAGCLARPAAFDAMLAAAEESAASLRRFEIALPRSADRGEWLVWNGVGPTLDDEADRLPFETRAGASFPDAWGRSTDGVEIVYRSLSASGVGASSPSGAAADASSVRPIEVLRYAEGSTVTTSWSRTVPDFGSDDGIATPSVTLAREIRYDAPRGTLPCLLRTPAQGRTLTAGDALAADEVCARWSDAPWRAGAPIEAHGLRALPLYQVDRSDGVRVARWLAVDGLAYPIEVEAYGQRADGIVRHDVWRLVGLDARGDALPRSTQAPEPTTDLAPLDPLRGPADEGALAFPLAEAADAALRDPTLREAQAVLARRDSALVGAAFGLTRDEATRLTVERWALVFAAADAAPAWVQCSRAQTPLALPPRCEALDAPPGYAEPIRAAPSMGRDALPPAAASFAAALARWGEDEPVGFALYRAWEDDGAPVVGVGRGVPAALAPSASAATSEGTYALVELATGRSLAQADVVQATAGLADTPLGSVQDASIKAGGTLASGGQLPLVVGAGIALGLVAILGFALYTRLVRARVLDDATRQQIVQVVRDDPGIHASGILERLDKSGGVGGYHLDVLVREGFLQVVSTPGFRRYFAAGSMSAPAMKARATLRDGACEKVHALILARPGMTLGEVAEAASISTAYASKTVARLVDAGLVEKRVEGRTIALLGRRLDDPPDAASYVRP